MVCNYLFIIPKTLWYFGNRFVLNFVFLITLSFFDEKTIQ